MVLMEINDGVREDNADEGVSAPISSWVDCAADGRHQQSSALVPLILEHYPRSRFKLRHHPANFITIRGKCDGMKELLDT
jgi:hypothetical protein